MLPHSFGIDLSHHNDPARVPWERVKRDCAFVFVRATYGTTRDRKVAQHVERVHGAGAQLGLYHFFRPSKTVDAQLAAFKATASAVGYGEGDILPAIDLEDDLAGDVVTPAWNPAARDLAESFVATYGGAILYLSASTWIQLGRPDWPLEYRLWVPHYTGAAMPRTPGQRPWLIWQHRVDTYDPRGPGGFRKGPDTYDHNIGASRLPVIDLEPDSVDVPPHEEEDDDADWRGLRYRAHAAAVDVHGIVREESLRNDHRVDDDDEKKNG